MTLVSMAPVLLRRLAAALLGLACAACSSVRPVYNAPFGPDMRVPGYRMSSLPATAANGNELFVAASFSGGGARAAALAYGVLMGMRETELALEGQRKTLFDELDVVTAVSGGSLPAAYLAARGGDRFFPDFHDRVLMRDLHGDFLGELLSPLRLEWLFSSRYGRGDVLAAFLDREIFQGARFADVLARGQRPWVSISATDMSLGARFEFVQDQFDLLCSDLGSVHLATAVAASAAVPVVLSPITLRNYDAPCPATGNSVLYGLFGDRRRASLIRQSTTYLDKQARPFIHLLDGGLSDNSATRGPLETTVAFGGMRAVAEDSGAEGVQRIVFVVVNAEGNAGFEADRSDRVPSVIRVTQAVADIPLGRYSNDSQEQLREALARWAQEFAGPDGRPLPTYYIEVSLQDDDLEPEIQALRNLPTALSLPPDDADRVVEAGRRLFLRSPERARLLRDLKRSP